MSISAVLVFSFMNTIIILTFLEYEFSSALPLPLGSSTYTILNIVNNNIVQTAFILISYDSYCYLYILTIRHILFTQFINQILYEMANIYFEQTHFDNEGKSLRPNII